MAALAQATPVHFTLSFYWSLEYLFLFLFGPLPSGHQYVMKVHPIHPSGSTIVITNRIFIPPICIIFQWVELLNFKMH